MEIVQQLGLFFGKTVILVGGLIAIILTLAAVALKNKNSKTFEVEVINDKLDEQKEALQSVVLSESELKKEKKRAKELAKEKEKQEKASSSSTETQKTAFLIDFLKGDVEASAVDQFKEEITALMTVAQPQDEVIIRVESPGGIVNGYGLASAQINRLRQAGLTVTICVDKVAASGGYLMACVGHKIVASPFAILGSIGVVAQVPNFHKILKKNDVEYKEYTAGDFKRTVSLFGEITEKGEAKFLEQLETTHQLFKNYVSQFRPQLDIARVATGEYWFGQSALDLKLIDEIMTSDDYIIKKTKTHKVIRISYDKKMTLSEKISQALSMSISSIITKLWSINNQRGL